MNYKAIIEEFKPTEEQKNNLMWLTKELIEKPKAQTLRVSNIREWVALTGACLCRLPNGQNGYLADPAFFAGRYLVIEETGGQQCVV